ncbi:MAG: hypothetical protein JSS28_03835 [Proteobacteria bacterium]|nr:hypothetical protein [Pseudomonadota bacterium]
MNRMTTLLATAALLASAGAYAQDQTVHFTQADGTRVTLTSGQPAPDHYGPPPAFAALDANHDGRISREEANAYPPLLNDFDYLAHHTNQVSKAQYERWVKTQN